MQALLDPALFGDLVDHISYNRGAPTATIFGRTVHILGSSDVRAESTIRGMTICIAYLDEATLVSKEFFSMLHSRLRVKGYACQLFVTTNPDAPRHWLKTDWIDREHDPKLNIRCFHFEIEDNRDNLPDGYIENPPSPILRTLVRPIHPRQMDHGRRRHLRLLRPPHATSSTKYPKSNASSQWASTTASTTQPPASSSAWASTTSCTQWPNGRHHQAPQPTAPNRYADSSTNTANQNDSS